MDNIFGYYMTYKKPKHNLSSYAYEKDWYFMTDLIDTFRCTGHCEKEWDKVITITEKDKKKKKFWR